MTRQSGLGRGLSALIPGSEPQEKEISEEEESDQPHTVFFLVFTIY